MKNKKLLFTLVIIFVGVGLYFWIKPSPPVNTNTDVVKQETVQGVSENAGFYGAYSPDKLALAETGKVVLFFRASWCPTCRALDKDIRANLENIPKDVVILDVDYDNSTALKQKYGVTYQHTLVQVDVSGNQIAKWTGSPTLSDLLLAIK